ncbi:mucoidy inhibitor-like protein, partial [Metarhizium majus ARSEF 297]
MEAVKNIEYQVRDLNTRSVILFPTKAQVSREITGVNLKPGTNAITVIGLSPTVEEESIKVEGVGSSAIITDITVESLPNRDIFEDIYPESDKDKSDSDSNDDSEYEEERERGLKMLDAESRLREVQDSLDLANEKVASAASRLKILDSYGTSLHARKEGVNTQQELLNYKREREQTFTDHVAGSQTRRELKEQVQKIRREIANITRQETKERAKEDKAKEKIRQQREKKKSLKRKRDQEQEKEKTRIRSEREKFWPQYCYSVCITIEYNNHTPLSSRRGSFASDAEMVQVSSPKTTEAETIADVPRCDLVLSYVTNSAGWAPSYDLKLSTTKATASLCFDAQLTNTTSETWSNCKVVMSTSQATFGGLDDLTPVLNPWKIKMAPKGSSNKENRIIRSDEELKHHSTWVNTKRGAAVQKPRGEMFANASLGNHALKDYQTQLMLLEQQNKKRLQLANNQFGNSNTAAGSGFGTSNMTYQQAQQPPIQPPIQQAMPQQAMPQQLWKRTNSKLEWSIAELYPIMLAVEDAGDDQATLLQTAEFDQALDFEESLMAETGFTTTYDLPGLKTLAPKSTSLKRRVARVTFSGVVFSHTVVAKYRPVANLKARLKNTSKLTLLRAVTGLTLDGTFMGRTSLPRCSAGDIFTLNLGVDPAIKLIYPKPEVRRATTGIFSKEDSSIYVRTLTMQNTRASAGKPVAIMVQDQIPVSEDERLRVELLNPKRVQIDSPGSLVGDAGRDARQDKDWGKATAILKKTGEVNWQVILNAGKAVRLSMEYSVSLPSGDAATQCWDS